MSTTKDKYEVSKVTRRTMSHPHSAQPSLQHDLTPEFWVGPSGGFRVSSLTSASPCSTFAPSPPGNVTEVPPDRLLPAPPSFLPSWAMSFLGGHLLMAAWFSPSAWSSYL
ncbi:hypothetical protein DPEC_G00336690 [Dallia pectoralis]|uniref:Uncharacterized protein n=1 Tax=Dallia pectoralis TaxID=75939 RepID=A0ACC2F7M2_DALPE|nr:hypothetical protein DPEC_G00336690 [Dallia pectoralis]